MLLILHHRQILYSFDYQPRYKFLTLIILMNKFKVGHYTWDGGDVLG